MCGLRLTDGRIYSGMARKVLSAKEIIMIPTKDVELSPYVENWNTRVTATPAAFGLSAAQATALDGVAQPYIDAQAALVAARVAGIRSASETATRDTAREALLPLLRELYTFVQASISVTDANKELLGVKVRSSARTPTPAPGAVSKFAAALNGNGSLTLTWVSENFGQGGTMYMVWRKIGAGGWICLGGSGSKEFTDMSIPPLTTTIFYQIQPVRPTVAGPWTQFIVSFSMSGETSVAEGTPVQLAA